MKILEFPHEEEEFEIDDPIFEVIVKKNGEIIGGTVFEEEETAYNILRYAGYSARETERALKGLAWE